VHSHRKGWATAAGATLSLISIVGFSIGVAGANAVSSPANPAPPAVQPGASPVGTYTWYFNGSAGGTINLLADYTFTSTDSTNDSGGWVQSGDGKLMALSINGGSDTAQYDCVFVAKMTAAGSLGNAAKPGHYSCPGTGNGTFYAVPGSSSARPSARSNAAVGSTASSLSFTPGKYNLFVVGQKLGNLNFTKGNEFTSNIYNDAGSWVTSGNAFAMTITSTSQVAPNAAGCVFVGALTSTGLNSTAAPDPYVCGETLQGDWWAIKKG